MKFSIKTLRESLEQPKSGKKVFTKGKKQNVILSEEQLDRLMSSVNENKPLDINRIINDAYRHIRISIITEGLNLDKAMYSSVVPLTEQGMYDRNPGIAAAEGVENVINGIKKAYAMIKDSDTRKKLANSITKLSNFMSISAELIGSGASQRAPRSYDSVSKELPYPELEVVTDDSELEEIAKGDYQLTKEDAKPDFLDLDGDGDKKESMKKASKEVKEDSGHDEAMNYGRDEGHDDKELYDLKHGGGSEDHIDDLEDDMHYDHIHDSKKIEESQKEKEMLIQEDIKRMKQIIRPIRHSGQPINEQYGPADWMRWYGKKMFGFWTNIFDALGFDINTTTTKTIQKLLDEMSKECKSKGGTFKTSGCKTNVAKNCGCKDKNGDEIDLLKKAGKMAKAMTKIVRSSV